MNQAPRPVSGGQPVLACECNSHAANPDLERRTCEKCGVEIQKPCPDCGHRTDDFLCLCLDDDKWDDEEE